MAIYLDNAATTIIASPVLEVMKDVMDNVHGNPSSIHQAGRKAKTIIEDARKRVAAHLKASTGEVYFTSSATEANNTAIHCAVRDLSVQRIISSPTEHPCVLNTLSSLEHYASIDIQMLDVDPFGNVDLAQLDNLLESGPKTLVSLMHGNNEIGTMLPIHEVSEICQKHGALFHTDAVQTIGKYDIDLSKTKVNFLSASGHKIYGPKGIGMLYISNDSIIKPYIHGGGQERQIRSGTENLYGIAGMAAALDWLVEHRQEHLQHVSGLRTHLKAQAKTLGLDFIYQGNLGDAQLANIVSIGLPKNDKTDLVMFNLDIHGICASTGSACSSGAEQGSHVMQAIGFPGDRKALRISTSLLNTTEEIDKLIGALATLVRDE